MKSSLRRVSGAVLLASWSASLSAQVSLVPAAAVWRYWDQGTLPAFDWFLPAYDDSAWPSGPAQLGFGERCQVLPA